MKKSVLESIIRKIIRENEDLAKSNIDIGEIHKIFIDQIASNLVVSKIIGKLFALIIDKIFRKTDANISSQSLKDVIKKAAISASINQKIQEIIMKPCKCEGQEREVIKKVIEKLANSLTSDGFVSEILFEIMYENFDKISLDYEPFKEKTFFFEKEKWLQHSSSIMEETPNRIASVVVRWIFFTGKFENLDIFQEHAEQIDYSWEVDNDGRMNPFLLNSNDFKDV